jgi:type IV secretory pathway ATPase VirB11/archaellum biosynthesis ATPase
MNSLGSTPPDQSEPVSADEALEQPMQPPTSLQSMRPAGADQWSSATDRARARPAERPYEYAEQSKRIIEAIEAGLREPACSQIDSYGPGKVSAQVHGEQRLMEGMMFASVDDYLYWLKNLVDSSHDVTTWAKIEDERMGVLTMDNGERLTIFLPPVAKPYPTFSIRKHVAANWQPINFVERGTLTETMLRFLQACVAARVNILLVGQMGSGKTTLLRALSQGFGDNEKIAVVEQVPELKIRKPLAVQYVYQPTVEGLGLSEVLDFSLYNGIDRLIVGEVHLQGITKMLETMIITEGSMSTYHAFSTEQAAERMKLALQIENGNVSAQTAISFVKQAVELVVVLEKVEGQRRCTQITEIDWRSTGGQEILGGRNLFIYDREAKDPSGRPAPGFRATNPPDQNGRILAKARDKYNVEMPFEWFINHEQLAKFQRRPSV